MTYRYAVVRESFEDLASGGVLRSAPGFPAFPVRLASEAFQRARAVLGRSSATVWDPCCGSGSLLTALALLHRREIERAIGTDVDVSALSLARRNVALLGPDGLIDRAAELRARSERFGKPGYAQTADAAHRLHTRLTADGGPLPHRIARADVFDPDQLRRSLAGWRPDLVITDVPYGRQTMWTGPHAAGGIRGLLRALASVLDEDAVIAIATRGRMPRLLDGPRPVTSFKVGTRAVTLFRAGNGRSTSDEGNGKP